MATHFSQAGDELVSYLGLSSIGLKLYRSEKVISDLIEVFVQGNSSHAFAQLCFFVFNHNLELNIINGAALS